MDSIDRHSGRGVVLPEAVVRELEEANRKLGEANRRMHQDLASAARVQQTLLPASHFRVPGLNIAWRLRPCEELAGDLLNCIRVDERHMAFFVLDVSGHGVSAALLSVQLSRMLSPAMSESALLKEPLKQPPWYRVVEPWEVLHRLNALFQMNPDVVQYFTIFYGLLEHATRRLRFASAGHPGPIHVPERGDAVAIRCSSHPIGFFEEPRVAEGALTLAPGDRIWVFSDGVTEVADSHDRELSLEGLKRQVCDQREAPVDRAVEQVLSAVETWCQPGRPGDDCTLLVIEAGS